MLSGLSASPLVNGLLAVLVSGVGLLALPARGRLGNLLQFTGLLLLLAIGLAPLKSAAAWLQIAAVWLTLAAVTLRGIGERMTLGDMQQRPPGEPGLPSLTLRSGREIGKLLGDLLTGLLFPLGRAALQFSVALLLLLLPLVPPLRLRRGGMSDMPPLPRPEPAAPLSPVAAVAPAVVAPAGARHPGQLLRPHGALLQGLLFGALFALLPLWIRRQAEGTCFDFGMVLTAYGLGRCLAPPLVARVCSRGVGRLITVRLSYAVMALLLLASQPLPGWGAVALFLPFGLCAALSDQLLLGATGTPAVVPPPRSERALAVGRLLGIVLMGSLTQSLGLGWALPLQSAAFLVAAVLPIAAPPRLVEA